MGLNHSVSITRLSKKRMLLGVRLKLMSLGEAVRRTKTIIYYILPADKGSF